MMSCLQDKTLVLNQSYRPEFIIPWTKAVMMLHRGSAEVVELYSSVVYTNHMRITSYDISRFGPLGRFFDEELIDEETVKVSLRMPAVIRLKEYVSDRPIKFSRQNIFLRDNFECQYEGCRISDRRERILGTRRLPPEELTFDHVLPQSRGGKTEWENIVTACCECNVRKGNRTPEEAGMRLRKPPVVPKTLPVVKTPVSTPDEWKAWLWMNVELLP